MVVVPLFLCLSATSVLGERPKDTSYGYVPPDESKAQEGYSYEPPSVFVVQDEPVTPGYVYVPPQDDLQPPLHDEIVPTSHYLPARRKSQAKVKETTSAIAPLHIEVNEMSCYDTPADGRFRAAMTFKTANENVPVFEDGTDRGGCEVRSDHAPPRVDTKLRMDIGKRDFRRCGVRECGAELMCVRLRFPTVRGLRLPEDAVLTLQCRTRDKIVTHTKHLQFDIGDVPLGRTTGSVTTSGVVAKGGGRGLLRSRTALYRKNNRGEYTEPLPPNARVPLGDTLMLRTDIEPDDGWSASRLGLVTMRALSEFTEEMVLLQPDGCRAPRAYVLCPLEPVAVSPLAHTMFIRAALFEGMRSGEEIRLSVKLVACLEANDCRLPSPCGTTTSRSRRQAVASDVANSTAVLSFKVVVPDEPKSLGSDKGVVVVMMATLCAVIACSAAALVCVVRGSMCST